MSENKERMRRDDEACPLVAHETFVYRGTLCGLRLHYLESPEQLLGDHCSVNFVLTPERALALAHALASSAEMADPGCCGSRTH